MSGREEEISSWKRLTFCPRCDYALNGLPQEGACPECGHLYDPSIVVLRGKPRGSFATLLDAACRHPFLTCCYVLSIGWFVYDDPVKLQRNSFVVAGIAYLLCLLVVDLLSQLHSLREGKALLWIERIGIGQAGEADPAAVFSQIRPRLHDTYFGGLFFFLISVMFVPISPPIVLPIAFVLNAIVIYFLVRNRLKLTRVAGDGSPALVSWSEVKDVKIQAVGENAHRVTITSPKRFPSAISIADIELALTADEADQLRLHIYVLQHSKPV